MCTGRDWVMRVIEVDNKKQEDCFSKASRYLECKKNTKMSQMNIFSPSNIAVHNNKDF